MLKRETPGPMGLRGMMRIRSQRAKRLVDHSNTPVQAPYSDMSSQALLIKHYRMTVTH